jgi:DNA polymerase-4
LRREADGTAFRLLGVGISQLAPEGDCDPADLVDDASSKRAATERAMDKVRAKFGAGVVEKGRGLRNRNPH